MQTLAASSSSRPPIPEPRPPRHTRQVLQRVIEDPVVGWDDADATIQIPRRTLLRWNGAMAIFHSVLAVSTLAVGNIDLRVPTYKTVLTFVERGNGTAWQLVPQSVPAGELNFTALVLSFFLVSAFFHAGNVLLWKAYYLNELAACRTPTRWIEYTISAPIMQVAIAYTLGVRDRAVIVASAALIATTMPFGYWTEMVARPLTPDAWTRSLAHRLLPWVLGHIPQLAAWSLILLQFYDGQPSGVENRTPDFVQAILFSELALFFSFGIAALLSQVGKPRYFYRGELGFQVLSLVSKGLLGIILMVSVLMLSRFEDIYEAEEATARPMR